MADTSAIRNLFTKYLLDKSDETIMNEKKFKYFYKCSLCYLTIDRYIDKMIVNAWSLLRDRIIKQIISLF